MGESRAHAALGASSADRWMNCGASIRLSANIPGTGDTEYSREGTSAHKVLEMALSRGLDPSTWLDTTVEGVLVSEDMTDAVQVCVDLVADIRAQYSDAVMWLERRFDLSALNPPADMFGTPDILLYSRAARKLWVIDYKHGQGWAVKAVKNPQLRYYGLGALLDIEKEIGFGLLDDIELVIVQPRATHADGIIRRDFLTYGDLAEFADDLLEAAHRALDPKAQPVAGPWCKWCRAQAVCPAQKALAAVTAQMDFSEETPPPPVETLSIETLRGIYEKKPIIEAWLKAVERRLLGELEAGRPVEGLKLVERRATRKWIEDEALVRRRLEEEGVKPSDYLETSLKSPPQVEKVVGKKAFVVLSDVVEKKSSGVNIAPMADSRPAAPVGAQNEFSAD